MLQFLCLLSFATQLWAHQSSLTPSGKEIYWPNPDVALKINTNTTDMPSNVARTIISDSIREWNVGSTAKLTAAESSNNEIKFVSSFPYGSAVIGVTEISYNTSGAIQRASILLNNQHYKFQAEPAIGRIFLGDVVTHELGHLMGLSHSEVLNASMFYSSFSGQSTISADDKSGLRNKYDLQSGVIQGYVKGGNSVGVLGAHVQAISRTTGEAIGAISGEDGFFRIGGLDLNDSYYLYTSPIRNPNSLPSYFSNTQTKFCPGTYVGSFFSACGRENDGYPTTLTLTERNSVIDVGTVSIACSLKTDPLYDFSKLQTNFAPVTILNYSRDQLSEKAFVGWFRSATSTWSPSDVLKIDLSDMAVGHSGQKYLRVLMVSYPFGNPLEYEMRIKRNGVLVSSATRNLLYSPRTKTYSTDFYTDLPLSTNPVENKFEVMLSSKKLDVIAETFPSYIQFFSERHLPYLMISSVMETSNQGLRPVLEDEVKWSDNEACLDAPFTYAVSKSASSGSEASSDSEAPAAVGCGSIGNPPTGGGPSQGLFIVTLGFLIGLVGSGLTRTKKFLS